MNLVFICIVYLTSHFSVSDYITYSMQDFGLLKDLVDKYISTANQQSNLMIAILVFAIVNVAVGIIGFGAQYFLKKEDINVHKRILRETLRMEQLQILYKQLDSMRNIFNDDVRLLSEVRATTSFINENSLLFFDAELTIARECCDYYSGLVVTPLNKDIQKESLLFQKFKNEFHK